MLDLVQNLSDKQSMSLQIVRGLSCEVQLLSSSDYNKVLAILIGDFISSIYSLLILYPLPKTQYYF